MVVHKKLMALMALLVSSAHALDTGSDYSSNVQLANLGRLLITIHNTQKSLSLKSLDDDTVSFVKLPSMASAEKNYGRALKVNSSRTLVAAGYGKRICDVDIVDLETTQVVQTLKKGNTPCKNGGSVYEVAGISWSDDDNLVAMNPWGGESHPWVIDRRTGEQCFTNEQHVFTSLIHPDGKSILQSPIGFNEVVNATVTRRSLPSNELMNLFENSQENAIAAGLTFSKNGTFFGVGTSNAFLLRDGKTYQEIKRLDFKGVVPTYCEEVFNEEESLVAVSWSNGINIYTLPDLTLVKSIEIFEDDVHQLDWNGNTLAAACEKYLSPHALYTWDITKELQNKAH